MINKEIIKTKLNAIRDNLLSIRSEISASNEQLKQDNKTRSALERYFQLLVDAAIGINEHIISEEKLEVPSDYFGTFMILGNAGVLPADFANQIAPSVGLRNQIIHQYEKIDVDLMLDSIRNNIHQYDKYMSLIIERYQLN